VDQVSALNKSSKAAFETLSRRVDVVETMDARLRRLEKGQEELINLMSQLVPAAAGAAKNPPAAASTVDGASSSKEQEPGGKHFLFVFWHVVLLLL